MRMFIFILSTVLFNGFMGAGWIDDIAGARNVVFGWVWIGLVFSFFALSDASVEILRKQGRLVPEGLNVTLFVAQFLFLCWFAEFALAAMLTVVFILKSAVRHKAFKDLVTPSEVA